MILLRQSDAFKKLLKQLVVDYTSSTIELSYGQVGRLAMIILGSGSVDSELHEKLVKDLKCSRPWELFILNMCGSIIGVKKGSVHVINTRETRCNLVRQLHQALVETYHTNWRTVFDYISPNCFLYLTERLLMLVSCFQGYVVTTKSCFIEWLMQNRDTKFTSSTQADVLISFKPILKFLRHVVREFLYDKKTTIQWIQRFITEWKEYYSLLVLRSVLILCLLYINFGMCFDVLLDVLRREHITEQLPTEVCDALRKFIFAQDTLSMDVKVNVLASAFKKAGNDLVVASLGIDCSRFFSSDSIFVDMKAIVWCEETFSKLLAHLHIHVPCSSSQYVAVFGEANANDCAGPSAFDSDEAEIRSSKLLQPDSGLEADEVKYSRNLPKDFDHLWDILEGLVKKRVYQRSLFSDASTKKLELEKFVFLLTSVWSARCPNAFEQILSGEVMTMLDDLMQLYAALDGSEQELRNKISTVAQLSRRLLRRRERIYWPEKIEPEFSQLFLENNVKLAGKELETIVNHFTAEKCDKTEGNVHVQNFLS